jgi:hypothetical protein
MIRSLTRIFKSIQLLRIRMLSKESKKNKRREKRKVKPHLRSLRQRLAML